MLHIVKKTTFLFLAYLALNATPVLAQQAEVGDCSNLGKYLINCSSFLCEMSNPSSPGLTIVQAVKGYDENDRCVHEQRMSNDQVITCRYTEDSRKYISIRMEQSKSKSYTNPREEQLEKMLMKDIFADECEILKVENRYE